MDEKGKKGKKREKDETIIANCIVVDDSEVEYHFPVKKVYLEIERKIQKSFSKGEIAHGIAITFFQKVDKGTRDQLIEVTSQFGQQH